ncbi:MAG TPA: alpha-ketoglutarate-dependent dioxygenase AlkB [Polyangia bacterium]
MAQAAPRPQPTLFGGGPPRVGPLDQLRRIDLDDTAWIEHAPAWVSGQDTLMAALAETTAWREERRLMYDRLVTVPRLVASLPDDGPGHPLLLEISRLLSDRYGVAFPRVSLGYYRSGADSVAWHGDTIARELPEALVATVSLGGPRRFLLRPKGGGTSLPLALGLGDLLIMGGACQRTWQHCIPKVTRAEPRIAVMFRPIWTPLAKKRG